MFLGKAVKLSFVRKKAQYVSALSLLPELTLK